MKELVVSLDIGGDRAGWAVLDTDGRCIGVGCWNVKPSAIEGPGMRYVKYAAALRSLLRNYRKGFNVMVVFENVETLRTHSSAQAAHVYGGIKAEIQRVCAEEKLDCYTGVGVSAMKKVACNNGNANKDMMLAAANDRWVDDLPTGPLKGKQYDEADALWAGETFLVSYGFKEHWHPEWM